MDQHQTEYRDAWTSNYKFTYVQNHKNVNGLENVLSVAYWPIQRKNKGLLKSTNTVQENSSRNMSTPNLAGKLGDSSHCTSIIQSNVLLERAHKGQYIIQGTLLPNVAY